MITEYTKQNLPNILTVINNAALRYKGIIPDDCWHEPYMSEQELIEEFDRGVRMFAYHRNDLLLGVMGIQALEDVTLIRHAYTLTDWQGIGIGKSLLEYLLEMTNHSRLLVGTWADAAWAIRFYVNNGFLVHDRKETNHLLKEYWKIPLKQMANSVVLERRMNFQ